MGHGALLGQGILFDTVMVVGVFYLSKTHRMCSPKSDP